MTIKKISKIKKAYRKILESSMKDYMTSEIESFFNKNKASLNKDVSKMKDEELINKYWKSFLSKTKKVDFNSTEVFDIFSQYIKHRDW